MSPSNPRRYLGEPRYVHVSVRAFMAPNPILASMGITKLEPRIERVDGTRDFGINAAKRRARAGVARKRWPIVRPAFGDRSL